MAMVIMAVVVIAVFKLNAQTIFINTDARFKATAPFLAQSRIEALMEKPLADIGDQDGDFGQSWPGYRWQLQIEDVTAEELGDVAERIKRIDVTVTLNDDEYSYHLRTYRFFND